MAMTLVVVLALVGGALAYFLGYFGHKEAEQEAFEEAIISVKSVHARYDKSFSITQKRPANVRPYYQASLETRVPGIVTSIPYDVGHIFKKGEKLVEVYVPDLVARKKQREADSQRAEAQVKQKEAMVKTANADVIAVKAKIEAAEARLKSDIAYAHFRKQQADRYSGLLAERAIDARLVDEQMDRYEAAKEAVISATAAVSFAKAELAAAQARVEQAEADLLVAKANVIVTGAELNYSQAMLEYGTIVGPFDGEISLRNVDPGFFVQNAGDGHATPLLVVQRNDIVTITVRVPDTYASYITPDTESIFETPTLPGVKIKGKVTRFPLSLVNPEKDRTMLVEVDLWNRDEDEFDKVKNDPKFLNDLKKPMPGDPNKGLPVVAKFKGLLPPGRQKRLIPGMFGEMTLILKKFDDVHMVPSSTIVTMGGYTYLYVVQDGKAHLQPIRVQIDDGKLALVEKLNEDGQSLGDLTGKEEIIATNQGELSEGTLVKTSMIEDWDKQLNTGHDTNEKKE